MAPMQLIYSEKGVSIIITCGRFSYKSESEREKAPKLTACKCMGGGGGGLVTSSSLLP